jgi:hypothetical protein
MNKKVLNFFENKEKIDGARKSYEDFFNYCKRGETGVKCEMESDDINSYSKMIVYTENGPMISTTDWSFCKNRDSVYDCVFTVEGFVEEGGKLVYRKGVFKNIRRQIIENNYPGMSEDIYSERRGDIEVFDITADGNMTMLETKGANKEYLFDARKNDAAYKYAIIDMNCEKAIKSLTPEDRKNANKYVFRSSMGLSDCYRTTDICDSCMGR